MKLGSDPEFFLMDADTGAHLPSCGLIGADKWNPLQLPGLSTGFMVQEDNVAVEFNIPPCESRGDFIEAMSIVRNAGLKFLRPKLPNTPLRFSSLSAHIFPAQALEHPAAKVFGCEPDFNAWTKKENPKPALKGKMSQLRTCGGHVHVETSLPKERVIQAMDLFLAVPLLGLETNQSYNGLERKKLYGKYGAYRPKSYGVEYRTLSNSWCLADTTVGYVWDGTERALDAVQRDLIDFDAMQETLAAVINGGNVQAAESLCSAFDIPQQGLVY